MVKCKVFFSKHIYTIFTAKRNIIQGTWHHHNHSLSSLQSPLLLLPLLISYSLLHNLPCQSHTLPLSLSHTLSSTSHLWQTCTQPYFPVSGSLRNPYTFSPTLHSPSSFLLAPTFILSSTPYQLPGEPSVGHDVNLVQYRSETVTLYHHESRMTLQEGTYSLSFRPVRASDSGVYICLVNNKEETQVPVRLIVRGKCEQETFNFW